MESVVDPEEYRARLMAYTIGHGPRVPVDGKSKPRPMTEDEAAAWLDEHCPLWRKGEPPKSDGVIFYDDTEDEL